jgi:hypothetical protein
LFPQRIILERQMIGPAEIADMMMDYADALAAAGEVGGPPAVNWPPEQGADAAGPAAEPASPKV